MFQGKELADAECMCKKEKVVPEFCASASKLKTGNEYHVVESFGPQWCSVVLSLIIIITSVDGEVPFIR